MSSAQICRSALLLVGLIAIVGASGQATDGDDQFQAYHHDIGRISGSNSPVAAQTSIRHEPSRAPFVAAAAPALPARKPNRIVLAVRPDRHYSESPPVEPVVPAPPIAALSPAPISAAPLPVVPLPVTSERQLYNNHNGLTAGSSISSQHVALIAQVNAERQQQHQHLPAASAILPYRGEQSQLVALGAAPAPINRQVEVAPIATGNSFVDQPEEPIEAPSFQQVLSNGCPHKGVFSWENKDHCDRYYMCTNGTFTEEACPNGLAYSQMGAVYQHCAYNWNVQCGNKKTAGPISSPGCPWQFGIFPIQANGRCSLDYFVCEWGVPETKRCSPEGLFYDERIKGCQWADQLGCSSEKVLNFKCPPEDEGNPYWPFPRYYHTNRDIIVCVNEQPRLTHCSEDQLVDPGSLACLDIHKKKPKKKSNQF